MTRAVSFHTLGLVQAVEFAVDILAAQEELGWTMGNGSSSFTSRIGTEEFKN